jgi:hypothetical protein
VGEEKSRNVFIKKKKKRKAKMKVRKRRGKRASS